MAKRSYILAHDLGTTGNKATLFDANATPVAATFFSYPTDYPRPNRAEQNPVDWRRAVCDCTRILLEQARVDAGDISVVSFSGHMQAALLVDRHGEPLHPAIIWADQRATAESDYIAACCGAESVYLLTGSRVSPAYTTAKLLWLKEHFPDRYRRAYRALQPKDYAAYLLTGAWVTDYSDASGTQAMDLRRRTWATDFLSSVGLEPELFPELHAASDVIGQVSPAAAIATGLKAGTPVVIGGGDGACATVGAGAVAEGDAYTYVGSSAWIGMSTRQPVFDPQQRTITFAHLDPELYFPLGNMQAAGGAYSWLESLWHRPEEAPPLFVAMDEAAAKVSPGAGGLLFLPHLLGERSPYWNPAARGAFVGLAMPHGRAEMNRAVLEGVAFTLRLILDTLQGQGVNLPAMRLIGGGARSRLWRQILADVYRLPILLPSLTAEATSLGAAIAGGVGIGLFPDFGVVRRLVPANPAEQPDPQRAERYEALYALFRRSYTALEPIFADLAVLAEED